MKTCVSLLCLLLAIAPAMADGNTDVPLAEAAEKKDAAAVCALLEQGCDVNVRQADGMTALHWAVYHDDEDLAQLLVKAGADVEAVNRYGVPPLSIACMNGSGKIVEMLLEAGADPHAMLPAAKQP